MSEEVNKILKMVQDGKISTEEAAGLLSSLGESDEAEVISFKPRTKKFIRVEVYSKDGDGDNETTKVKINIPLNLARTMLNLNLIKNQISVNASDINIDFDELVKLIEQDAEGELVNIESNTARVRIWIE